MIKKELEALGWRFAREAFDSDPFRPAVVRCKCSSSSVYFDAWVCEPMWVTKIFGNTWAKKILRAEEKLARQAAHFEDEARRVREAAAS